MPPKFTSQNYIHIYICMRNDSYKWSRNLFHKIDYKQFTEFSAPNYFRSFFYFLRLNFSGLVYYSLPRRPSLLMCIILGRSFRVILCEEKPISYNLPRSDVGESHSRAENTIKTNWCLSWVFLYILDIKNNAIYLARHVFLLYCTTLTMYIIFKNPPTFSCKWTRMLSLFSQYSLCITVMIIPVYYRQRYILCPAYPC